MLLHLLRWIYSHTCPTCVNPNRPAPTTPPPLSLAQARSRYRPPPSPSCTASPSPSYPNPSPIPVLVTAPPGLHRRSPPLRSPSPPPSARSAWRPAANAAVRRRAESWLPDGAAADAAAGRPPSDAGGRRAIAEHVRALAGRVPSAARCCRPSCGGRASRYSLRQEVLALWPMFESAALTEAITDHSLPHCVCVTTAAAVKVIDFGSACMEGKTVYSYIQSRYCMSPEVLLGCPYTIAIHLWSFGCIVSELFIGVPLFPGASEYDVLQRMIMILGGQPPDDLIREAKNSGRFFKHVGCIYSCKEAHDGFSSAHRMLTEEEVEAPTVLMVETGSSYENTNPRCPSLIDAQELLSHVHQEEKLINKKQRWLASMISKPDGNLRIVKRPKFLKDAYDISCAPIIDDKFSYCMAFLINLVTPCV